MAETSALEDLARQALGGDRDALDRLVRHLQTDVYGLALRMLWNREDAEDATQEILVRVVTRLAQFDSRSKLRTWVYRIAVDYILDVKKSPVERMQLNFHAFSEDLADGLSSDGPTEVERSLLIEEVKIACTLGMLQWLDRPHRLAYVLGEILELPGPEAAEALDIAPELFRKRLQHARAAIEAFTRVHCGLVSDSAACGCHRRVPAAIRLGRPMRWTSPSTQRRIRRPASLFAALRRRDGRFRSIAPVSRAHPPSMSLVASRSPSARPTANNRHVVVVRPVPGSFCTTRVVGSNQPLSRRSSARSDRRAMAVSDRQTLGGLTQFRGRSVPTALATH
jgi:RNA polymerase sigma factor (sigma-70 family)